MAFDKLKPIIFSAILILYGLLLTLFCLPLFSLWRLLLLLLHCTCEPLRLTYTPNLALHTTAHASFHRTWTSFLKLPCLQPILKYRVRLICSSLLLIQTLFALAIFGKASTLFLPWVLRGGHTKGELHVHSVLFLGACAPVAWVGGVGVAVLYYARKVWKYGRFEKKMRRRPGGRGYWVDPGDVEEKMGGGDGQEEVAIGGDAVKGGRGAEQQSVRWTGSTLVDGRGRPGEQSLQLEDIRRPEAAAMCWGNSVSRHGVSSLRNVRDKFQSGYDGREMRRAAWQAEEIEMDEISKQ
ncbi:hypothetical protein J1614_008311 [Plenodomus biglobosus]|nr:hypothetical protein J1614_008311 [Plenodomus biglobosus]